MGDLARKLATAEDLRAIDDGRGAEVVGGEIVYKAMPTYAHGSAQMRLGGWLSFGGGDGIRGWWFATEVEIELERHETYRPDVAGWRRERVPGKPEGWPITERPDWVCEVLSPSTASRDLGKKRGVYHRSQIGHYWVVDTTHRTLTVFRWHEAGYLLALSAGADETVRAEPFDALDLPVAQLFEN